MNEKTIWIAYLDHGHLGPIWVATSESGVVAVQLRSTQGQMLQLLSDASVRVDRARLAVVLEQLSQYLSKEKRSLDVTVDWSVLTPFQADVLRLVKAIPYGETRTYQQIAEQIGNPGAARAVGQANATNPMPLIIPCHRVVGTDGSLRGYGGAGGVETKAWLLKLEGSRLL